MANRKSIRLNEIEELLLVLPSNGYSTRKFINNIFKKAGLSPSVAMEINDIPTLLALVKTGLWHTILAQTTVSESDGLCSIPIKDNELYRKAMIISLKDVYEKKAVLAFYKILLDK